MQLLAVILEFQEILENYNKRTEVFCRITNAPSASMFLSYSLNLKALSILSLQKHLAYIRTLISCGEAYKIHSRLPVQECLYTALYIVYKKKKNWHCKGKGFGKCGIRNTVTGFLPR